MHLMLFFPIPNKQSNQHRVGAPKSELEPVVIGAGRSRSRLLLAPWSRSRSSLKKTGAGAGAD